MMKGVRRGCVRLKGAVLGIDDQDVTTFTITVDQKTFHFQVFTYYKNFFLQSPMTFKNLITFYNTMITFLWFVNS